MTQIIDVTDDTFEEQVGNARLPVLVDFWAEWCGPCKMIAPLLKDISTEYAGTLIVAKLNIDDNPLTPHKFQVRGIPTLILFQNGEAKGTQVGALTRTRLTEFLAEMI